ncbi:hypothetical protein Bbelb_015850 [Branchiostoma belcheri]|nr:hypothetical protein Bbelb_015850 [Branchiostoma belcheri]
MNQAADPISLGSINSLTSSCRLRVILAERAGQSWPRAVACCSCGHTTQGGAGNKPLGSGGEVCVRIAYPVRAKRIDQTQYCRLTFASDSRRVNFYIVGGENDLGLMGEPFAFVTRSISSKVPGLQYFPAALLTRAPPCLW